MQDTRELPPEASDALRALQMRLPESLLAAYLHGSAASGGLRPHSDVDLLAIVDKSIDCENAKRLASDLLRLSGRYPFDAAGRRPLELIIFTLPDLSAPRYPARCNFLYGEWLRASYEEGNPPGPTADPEYTLILAQARQEAKTLFGPDAKELLPVIPQSDIRRAIGDALPALLATLPGDERNVLLTLARMWRTAQTGDFAPKDAAAAWAAGRLPDEQAGVLAQAREEYLGLRGNDWRSQRRELRQTACALQDCVMKSLS